jgi:NAD(P)-dependent dehydrogenase (short-subunit alcohol dehydrogenase family)
MHLDVTSEQNWARVVDAVMASFGRLDILLNNAGVGFPGKVENITVDIWDRELGVHAKGVFLGTRTAMPAMRKGGGGSIINTSSVMGIVGSPTSPAYSAAKAPSRPLPSRRRCNMRRRISASIRSIRAMRIRR